MRCNILLLSLLAIANAYIPALPTNSTKDAIAAGLNVTDISKLSLQWYSNGSYNEHVSYQLAGNGSTGISKGILVHFSEEMADNNTAPTSTPWIALVSCDKNATNASMVDDIFTLARDKGAVSALLYSLTSAACIINPEYADPSTFDQVFDIFSTQSATSSHLIEYQFGQLAPQNKSIFKYDSQQLNTSANDILRSLDVGYPVSTGYLLAALQAYNATDPSSNSTSPGGNSDTASPNVHNSSNTALAMIILYAITGCVSALFCVVIISGAIRAFRHPERYGPRARMDDNGLPQSRARGLTRAILDTFPIVKFGAPASDSTNVDKDPEIQQPPITDLELKSRMPKDSSSTSADEVAQQSASYLSSSYSGIDASQSREIQEFLRTSSHPSTSSQAEQSYHLSNPDGHPSSAGETSSQNAPQREQRPLSMADVALSAIGRETCPICIVDFEEGDDIRLLPCEGKHCFHQQCVDPWLLQLSSSCPICRHDFLALENMLSGNSDEGHEEVDPRLSMPRASHAGRFSRYLRFARRHNHRRDQSEEHEDPTDPYMPTAPETTVYPGTGV